MLQIRQWLASNITPLYLFKNVVRNGPKGLKIIWFSSTTFVQVLNDDFVREHLLSFVVQSTRETTNFHSYLTQLWFYYCTKCSEVFYSQVWGICCHLRWITLTWKQQRINWQHILVNFKFYIKAKKIKISIHPS